MNGSPQGNVGVGANIAKENLLKRYGGEITLPDLRHEIANCERHGKLGDACAIHYVGLT